MKIIPELSHYFHIDYRFSHCLDLENSEFPNVEEIKGEIFYNDYDGESDPIKIGDLELHYYNDAFWDYGFDLYGTFDRSMDTIKLGSALIDNGTGNIKHDLENEIGQSSNPNILVIHEMLLYADYRGRGFGMEIISGIETFHRGKCGYIALHSFPRQHDISIKGKDRYSEFGLEKLDSNAQRAQVTLDTFYEKCGFFRIPCHKESFFIKNIDPM